jgi:hypothetical protein
VVDGDATAGAPPDPGSGLAPGVTPHWRILDRKRRALFKRLAALEPVGSFWLAGGTALALQAGHRRSMHFDFFAVSPGLTLPAERPLVRALLSLPGAVAETIRPGIRYFRVGEIRMSFIATPYPLVASPVVAGGLRLAVPLDIGAMKLAAIVSRGTRRDFIDLACILDRYATLREVFVAAKRKYHDVAGFPMQALKAMVYFADADGTADADPDGLDPRYGWAKVKASLEQEARRIAPDILRGAL